MNTIRASSRRYLGSKKNNYWGKATEWRHLALPKLYRRNNKLPPNMANTYTQIHVQIVFRVKSENNLISEKFRERIEKYICGIISNKKSKPLAIYCNPDHLHVLIGLHPSISVSDMARIIKTNSSKYINENGWVRGGFMWQAGFGAFSYSNSEIDRVVKYILNQREHHKKTTFREEYIKFLRDNKIDFNSKYLIDE